MHLEICVLGRNIFVIILTFVKFCRLNMSTWRDEEDEELQERMDSVEQQINEVEEDFEIQSGYEERIDMLSLCSFPAVDDERKIKDILGKIFDSYRRCVLKDLEVEFKEIQKNITVDKRKKCIIERGKCEKIWDNCWFDGEGEDADEEHTQVNAKMTSQLLKKLEASLKDMQTCEKKLAEL